MPSKVAPANTVIIDGKSYTYQYNYNLLTMLPVVRALYRKILIIKDPSTNIQYQLQHMKRNGNWQMYDILGLKKYPIKHNLMMRVYNMP